MVKGFLAGKLLGVHASKDAKSKMEECSNQWRWMTTKRSGDEPSHNHGSPRVANAAMGERSGTYADDMYKLWLKDKTSVHSSWDRYFHSMSSNNDSTSAQSHSIGASKNKFDKNRLVQFVNPRQADSGSETKSSRSISLRDDDGPIIITIDILHNDEASMKSKISDAKSIETINSAKTIKTNTSSLDTVQEQPVPKVPVANVQDAAVKPEPSTQALIPAVSKLTHHPANVMAQQRGAATSKQMHTTSVVTWEKHCKDFKRFYILSPAHKEPVFSWGTSSSTPGTTFGKIDSRTGLKIQEPKQNKPNLVQKLEKPNEKSRPARSKREFFQKTKSTPGLSQNNPPSRRHSPGRFPEGQPKPITKTKSSTSVKSVTEAKTSSFVKTTTAGYTKPADPPKTTSKTDVQQGQAASPIQGDPNVPTQVTVKPTQSSAATTINSPPLARNTSNADAGASFNKKADSSGGGGTSDNIKQHLAVQGVIRSYQNRGHLIARLDPLLILDKGKTTLEERKGFPPDTITRQHKALKGIDLNTKFVLPPTTFIGEGATELALGEIIKKLESAYSQHIGVEFMYIQDMKKTLWIREQMETAKLLDVDKKTKRKTLEHIIRATRFEAFCAKHYPSDKRFGLEGCEALIPCIREIVDTGTDLGVEGVNIAMAHRGRLNVLSNVCGKSLKDIFTTFLPVHGDADSSGDVKYHLGTSALKENPYNKKKVRISIVANPSHLECSVPLVLGKTRCEQFMKGDKTGASIVGIYIHGDAAYCGQGIVYESMHLTHLPYFTTRGAIHIVVNNQVGFTTDPRFSRSSVYPTDVGRVVMAPIFHVNADDPDAVTKVSRIAAKYRQMFNDDVVLDLFCYRRNGHNEHDEPMFTQPLMYQIIRKYPNIEQLYSEQLIKEGVVTQAEVDAFTNDYKEQCRKDYALAKHEKEIKYSDWLDSPWKGFFKNYKFDAMPTTGVQEDVLKHIGTIYSTPPKDFVVHKGITRILKGRAKFVADRVADWSIGEAFAFGTLLKEGYHVRLSGQDVERGTFGHRHHVMHHQTVDKKVWNSLEHLYPNQAPYTVCNSSLSEYAVMGFEMGYNCVSPHQLTIWEAQYGDFANTGQTIIDCFVSSCQSKWRKQCGLVINLPHGLEGHGPEHSSARLERYLSMCDDDVHVKGPYDEKFVLHQHEHCNWFVCNVTSPANLFHLLRRQIKLPFRKPLISTTPKGFLRHPLARSSFDDFLEGTSFLRVLPDTGPASKAPDGVQKLIFCSGNTYFDLIHWITEAKMESKIALVRTEQVSPFPYDLVAAEIKKYSKAKVFWAQAEHKNQGCWPYVHERINGATENKIWCGYNGRPPACAPATGNKHQYLTEVAAYKADVLKIS